MNKFSRKIRRIAATFLVLILLLTSWPIDPARGVIESCSATISPSQVNSGSTNNFVLNINNTSSNDIVWIKITRPSANFTLGNIIATGWTKTITTESITLANGSLSSGANRTFTLTSVVAANVNSPAANWLIQTSDNSAGANPTSCSGSLGTQIGNVDTTAPLISNIAVSNISNSSATVSWVTNEPATSRVNFGLTSGYGSTASSATLTLNHSLNLTALAAGTAYHFQVQSSDASSNSASSSDNTFLTQASTTSTVTSSPNSPAPASSGADQTVPIVNLATNLTNVYKEAPNILGTASDNVSILSVEYSTDAGENWLLVDKNSGLNQREVSFEFKPQGLSDGNYDLLVRAVDSSENVGLSSKAVLIIDLLPPMIGPNVLSFGSQLSFPQDDLITAVIGVDQRISIATIGGPTSLVIKANNSEMNAEKVFTLTKLSGTNLWSGVLAFEEAGNYSLEALAVDGAGNKVTRTLNKVHVGQPSRVVSSAGEGIKDAKVSVNYFDPESKQWYLWDAPAFGQTNPQTTKENGEFDFFLPAGKYYIKVEKKGYYSAKSEIFVQEKADSLSAEIVLEKVSSFNLAGLELVLPRLSFNGFKINQQRDDNAPDLTNQLEGKSLGEFTLESSLGGQFDSNDLLGKPTLISFVNTWTGSAEEQLTVLEELVDNKNYRVLVIASLESAEKIKAYSRIGGYKSEFLFDPQGVALDKFNLQTVPAHLIIDRDQKIVETLNGILPKEELQQLLIKL